MAADKSCGLCRNVGSLEQQSAVSGGKSGVLRSGFLLLRGLRLGSGILRWGGFLLLGSIQTDRLRIRLSGHRSAIGDISTHAELLHDVHPNQAGRLFLSNNDYEAGAPACFAPLQIQMLRFSCYLARFSSSAVHDSHKMLQGTPLGAVSPPH